jgi:hypothetical protein
MSIRAGKWRSETEFARNSDGWEPLWCGHRILTIECSLFNTGEAVDHSPAWYKVSHNQLARIRGNFHFAFALRENRSVRVVSINS